MQMKLAVKKFSDLALPVLVSYRIAPNDGVELRPDLKACDNDRCINPHIFYMYVFHTERGCVHLEMLTLAITGFRARPMVCSCLK